MKFLSGLFRLRDAPRNNTSGSAYRFFMGSSTSGKRVNERSAMQIADRSIAFYDIPAMFKQIADIFIIMLCQCIHRTQDMDILKTRLFIISVKMVVRAKLGIRFENPGIG